MRGSRLKAGDGKGGLTTGVATGPRARQSAAVAPRLETILARQLRRDMTGVERRLWAHLCLRQLDGYKFRRQSPIGPYIVDFLCVSERLVVEVDRPTHDDRLDADAFRDAWLRAVGYRVLRFPS